MSPAIWTGSSGRPRPSAERGVPRSRPGRGPLSPASSAFAGTWLRRPHEASQAQSDLGLRVASVKPPRASKAKVQQASRCFRSRERARCTRERAPLGARPSSRATSIWARPSRSTARRRAASSGSRRPRKASTQPATAAWRSASPQALDAVGPRPSSVVSSRGRARWPWRRPWSASTFAAMAPTHASSRSPLLTSPSRACTRTKVSWTRSSASWRLPVRRSNQERSRWEESSHSACTVALSIGGLTAES